MNKDDQESIGTNECMSTYSLQTIYHSIHNEQHEFEEMYGNYQFIFFSERQRDTLMIN